MVAVVKRLGVAAAARSRVLVGVFGAIAFSMLSVGVSFASAGTPVSDWGVAANSSLLGGESDLTALVTDHLPYIVGVFVAMLALGWITSKISKTARGKKV